MDLNNALDIMMQAGIRAGQMLLEIQPQAIRIESKKDFLTDADLRSEDLILEILNSYYPEIPSLSEEKGGEEIKEGYLWIIDPIDGTVNFFSQDDHWGVSIALVKDSRTIAGLIYLPARGRMFSAAIDRPPLMMIDEQKKEAVFLHRVNQINTLADAQVRTCWGKEEHNGQDHERVYELIKKLDQHTLYPQIRNCATADLMAVVEGKISGHVFTKPTPFDIAAAGLIIEKAGGSVTDMAGNPWNPFSRSLVSTNGLIHKELLAVIN